MSDPFSGKLLDQFSTVPMIDRDLQDKVIIITGANTGLGFEAAKHFARINAAKIILAVRNMKKGNEARDKIQAETGFNNIVVRELDLSSFDSVKSFVDGIQKSEERLDILISNAAVANGVRNVTKDGWEESIQVNHLSNMLLLTLMVPLLRKTAKQFQVEPRIVVVSSEVHTWSKFPEGTQPEILTYLHESKDTMRIRYPVTKLLNILMTRKFAQVIPDITIHCLNPGFCKTELSRDLSYVKSFFFNLFRNMIGRTAEQGSRTLVHAAIFEGWDSQHIPNARYFSNCIEIAPTKEARNKNYQDKVWAESTKILLKVEPRIANILGNKN